MGSMDLELAKGITDHLKREVLAAVPTEIDQLDSGNVEILRSKLHVLHYYCLQKGIDSDIINRLEAILETSRGFWELLEDNTSTFADLKETHKMRWLSLSSAVLTELEEIMSGEESFRDIIVNSIAIILGWKSDTVWVDMAKEEQRLVSKAHLVRLRDELWKFIGESSRNGSEMTLEKAIDIGEKMNLLLEFIAGDDLPVLARVMLLSQVYILLLRLNIGKILVILEANSEED
ncbi:hypothetical protein ACFL6S_25705 [Candidatus Poribacteria bacterium]